MLLIGVKENQGWLTSRWNLTYKIGWDGILKACESVLDYYEDIEILVDNEPMGIKSKDKLMSIKESRSLTFRGISTIIKVPIMITFYNQMNVVDVNVAMATNEFLTSNYENFNKSLCQYMDSIELAIIR